MPLPLPAMGNEDVFIQMEDCLAREIRKNCNVNNVVIEWQRGTQGIIIWKDKIESLMCM